MTLGTTGLFASLGLLALIDATSIGTLVIPVWLVLRSKSRQALIAAVGYVAVIGLFYLAIGLLLLSGAGWISTEFTWVLLDLAAFRWAVLLLGASMLSWALLKKPRREKVSEPEYPSGGGREPGIGSPRTGAARSGTTGPRGDLPDTEGRWAGRLDNALASKLGIVGLGITAGLLELPTMLPYLGAIGLLTQSDFTLPLQAGLLVIYCLVMLLPGLTIIGARAVAGRRLQSFFEKISTWLTKASGETLLWVVGILGFLMVRSSLGFLFPTAGWNPFK